MAPVFRPPPRQRPRVKDAVLGALAEEIVSGRSAAGDRLPPEIDIATAYGVSRTVIREVLKLLISKGLIESRPRAGTIVRDRGEWNVLDPQVLEWLGAQQSDPALADAVLEARRVIEPAAAAMAAERATLQEISELDLAVSIMRETSDPDEFLRADMRYHDVLLTATHNPIFRQLGTSLQAALEHVLSVSAARSDDYRPAARLHGDLVEAVRLRDADTARRAMERIIDSAAETLTRRTV